VGTVGPADKSLSERHMGRWLARVSGHIAVVAEDCMDPHMDLEHILLAVLALRCVSTTSQIHAAPLTFACPPVASLLL
jgi:hypothetical protein